METVAILPCAGRSLRMRADKLNLPWGSQNVLQASLSMWKTAPVDRVIAVARADQKHVLEQCRTRGVECLLMEGDTPDMRATVSAAIQRVRGERPGQRVWFLAPADMPWLTCDVVEVLLAAHNRQPQRCWAPVFANGKPGHPILFDDSFASEIVLLPQGRGVDSLLEHFPPALASVGTDAIYGKLNLPLDWVVQHKRWLPHFQLSRDMMAAVWGEQAAHLLGKEGMGPGP